MTSPHWWSSGISNLCQKLLQLNRWHYILPVAHDENLAFRILHLMHQQSLQLSFKICNQYLIISHHMPDHHFHPGRRYSPGTQHGLAVAFSPSTRAVYSPCRSRHHSIKQSIVRLCSKLPSVFTYLEDISLVFTL